VLTWGYREKGQRWAVGERNNKPPPSFDYKWQFDWVLSEDHTRVLTWGDRSLDDKRRLQLLAVGLDSNEPLENLEYSEMIESAILSKDGSRVLVTSTDGTARLWRIPDICALRTSVGDNGTAERWRIAELEVFTASALKGPREVRALTLDQWQTKKREIDAVRAKRELAQ
jgi:hypothetical protein